MKLKDKKKKGYIPTRYSALNDELDHLPIKEVYPKLVKKLQVDLGRAPESILRQLIAECSEDTRLAGYIYVVAKDDYERIEAESEAVFGGLVIKAREEIAGLKAKKKWEGAAYSKEVERFAAAQYPDYLKTHKIVRESKRLYKAARSLKEAYEKRLSALQTYARLVEKKTGLSVTQRHG